jgi:hypothetical protein
MACSRSSKPLLCPALDPPFAPGQSATRATDRHLPPDQPIINTLPRCPRRLFLLHRSPVARRHDRCPSPSNRLSIPATQPTILVIIGACPPASATDRNLPWDTVNTPAAMTMSRHVIRQYRDVLLYQGRRARSMMIGKECLLLLDLPLPDLQNAWSCGRLLQSRLGSTTKTSLGILNCTTMSIVATP